jgi:hypothetical protein
VELRTEVARLVDLHLAAQQHAEQLQLELEGTGAELVRAQELLQAAEGDAAELMATRQRAEELDARVQLLEGEVRRFGGFQGLVQGRVRGVNPGHKHTSRSADQRGAQRGGPPPSPNPGSSCVVTPSCLFSSLACFSLTTVLQLTEAIEAGDMSSALAQELEASLVSAEARLADVEADRQVSRIRGLAAWQCPCVHSA